MEPIRLKPRTTSQMITPASARIARIPPTSISRSRIGFIPSSSSSGSSTSSCRVVVEDVVFWVVLVSSAPFDTAADDTPVANRFFLISASSLLEILIVGESVAPPPVSSTKSPSGSTMDCFRSRISAVAVRYRLSGFFCIHFWTIFSTETGMSGSSSLSGVASSWMCSSATDTVLSAANGMRPESISYIVTPRE